MWSSVGKVWQNSGNPQLVLKGLVVYTVVSRLPVIFSRTDCVARNLYDQSILVDQLAQVTAARELWLAQGGRLPIPFCGSLAKTLLPGGTTQNPYAQTHSGIRAQRAHEHHQ